MGKPVTIELDPKYDSSSYVFDVTFECIVREIDTMSDNDIMMFGVLDTGIESFNQANATQKIKVNFTIEQMAVHRSKNNSLAIVHPSDALKIYEFTQNHLQKWAQRLGTANMNGTRAPLEDLIMLDTFCNEIYEQAKYYDSTKVDSIERAFGRGMFSIREMLTAPKSPNSVIEQKNAQRRNGFADLFRDFAMKKNPFVSPNPDGTGSLNGRN